jgi:hypothetical protein
LGGPWDVALLIGGGGFGEGLEAEGDGEESPQLPSVTVRAAGRVEGTEGGEKDDAEIEGVGEKKALCGVVDGQEFKKEQRRYKEGESDEELGELAEGTQANLKGRAWRSGPGNGTAAGVSVHHSGAKKRVPFMDL